MGEKRKVIITCAVTGAVHTPSMSEYLPVTPQEIIDASLGAAEAGASIIHLHARNPETGQPDQTPEAFAKFLPQIHKNTDAVINLTTGGGAGMSKEERARPATVFKPEVASLNMGSINFALHRMLERYTEFKYDWEKPSLERSKDAVFRNSFADIEWVLEACGGNGTRFEFECYDIAHLYNLRHFVDRGLVKGPLFIQSVFGIMGGIGTHPEDVLMMKRTADRLFGDTYEWSVVGAGSSQMKVAMMSIAFGGNVRVGLEDSLWAGRGTLAKTNAEQVKTARRLIEAVGLEVATPDEAREMLGLKGAGKTAIG